MSSKKFIWILVFLYLVLGGLVIAFGRRDVWFDESYSMEIIKFPISFFSWTSWVIVPIFLFLLVVPGIMYIAVDFLIRKKIPQFLASLSLLLFGVYGVMTYSYKIANPRDVHPPLYYILLKVWTVIFGFQSVYSRIFSLIFGVLAIVVIYKLAKMLYGEKVARVTTIFMLICNTYIHYFTEIRMYSIFLLLSVFSIYALIRYMIKKPTKIRDFRGPKNPKDFLGEKKFLYLYFLSLVFYPYLHWYMAYPFLVQCLFILFFKKEFFKNQLYKFMTVFSLWVPALIYFYKQTTRMTMWSMFDSSSVFITFMSTLHFNFFFSHDDMKLPSENVIGIFFLLFFGAMIFIYVMSIDNKNEGKYTFYWMMYVLVPIVIGLIIRQFTMMYQHRYFAFLGWPLIMLMARGLYWPKKNVWKVTTYVLLVFAVILAGAKMYIYFTTNSDQLEPMAKYIKENYCSSDYVLLHETTFTYVPIQYYMDLYNCSNPSYLVPRPRWTIKNVYSFGGDVISNESLLWDKRDINKFGKILYFSIQDNLTQGTDFQSNVLLDYGDVQLLRLEKPSGTLGVWIDVKKTE